MAGKNLSGLIYDKDLVRYAAYNGHVMVTHLAKTSAQLVCGWQHTPVLTWQSSIHETSVGGRGRQ